MDLQKAAAETAKPVKRQYLSPKEVFLLTKYLQEKYTESGLGDPDFAKSAEQDLGFRVSQSQLYNLRVAWEIPANQPRGGNPNRGRINSLEGLSLVLTRRVEELEAQVATLMRERKEQHLARLGGMGNKDWPMPVTGQVTGVPK